MDVSLPVTIGLIFLGTSLVGFVRSRITDRCLRSFDGFHVTLYKADGKRVWGRLHLSAGGMEITFPNRDGEARRLKTSYLLYAAEYTLIQVVFRHADRLTADERRARDADIGRSFHPGPLRRLIRRLWLFLGSATDSLRDVLSLVVGRVQKMQDRLVIEEGASTLTRLGSSVLTEVRSIHDPLLERHVGRRVVVELVEGDEIHEHVGILKEYSAAFLQLLDVQYPEAWTMEVAADGAHVAGRMAVVRAADSIAITNHGDRPVLIQAVEVAETERSVDALVDPGGTVSLALGGEAGKVRLRLEAARDVDMIVPRSRSAVRNRAEQGGGELEPESAWDLVFDLGTLVRPRGDEAAAEKRLRAELEGDPSAAAAAARLGGMLLKRQELAEAGRWLRVAYNGRETLPDGGRRVRMQLRELARRHAQRSAGPPAD